MLHHVNYDPYKAMQLFSEAGQVQHPEALAGPGEEATHRGQAGEGPAGCQELWG